MPRRYWFGIARRPPPVRSRAAKALGLDHPAVAAGAGGSGHRMMDRRRFLLTSLAGALAAPFAAGAQQPGKVYRMASWG
jgi:hypothetical protein